MASDRAGKKRETPIDGDINSPSDTGAYFFFELQLVPYVERERERERERLWISSIDKKIAY